MTPDDLKALEKAEKRAKRIAAEKASALHDLVEDRLPAGYQEIPEIAQATYEACKAWEEANAALKAATAN